MSKVFNVFFMSKFVDDKKAGLDGLLVRSLKCDGSVVNTKELPEYAGFFSTVYEKCGDGGDQNADYKDDEAPNITGSIMGDTFEVYHLTMRAKIFYWFRYRLCDWFVIKWFKFVGKLRRYSNRIKKLFGGLF